MEGHKAPASFINQVKNIQGVWLGFIFKSGIICAPSCSLHMQMLEKYSPLAWASQLQQASSFL